jgi:hypothetical protein
VISQTQPLHKEDCGHNHTPRFSESYTPATPEHRSFSSFLFRLAHNDYPVLRQKTRTKNSHPPLFNRHENTRMRRFPAQYRATAAVQPLPDTRNP